VNHSNVGHVETEEIDVHVSEATEVSPVDTSFANTFSPSCIEVFQPKIGKSSVLSQLVSLLVREQQLPKDEAESVIQQLIEYERHGTTAIGRGLAFPHLRTSAVQQSVGAVAIVPDGINFNSLDGKPTRLVLMLLSPADKREDHIELMGRLVALVQNKTVQFLLEHKLTPAQVYEFLCAQDAPTTS